MGSTASKTWSLANGRGVDNRTHLKKKKIMGSTASKTWSLANGRGVDNRTHGRRTRRKRLWVRPRQRPGPSPTAGGSTTELTEEEKDYGFDRVKDLVPRQRQGGRQQNSRKKKRMCYVTWNFHRNFTMYSDRFDFIETDRYCSRS